MTMINPDSGNDTGMPDLLTRYLMALPPRSLARLVLTLPAEDVEWLTRATRRLVDGTASVTQLQVELEEYQSRPDGHGEGV